MKSLDQDELFTVADALSRTDCRAVCITGGEPLIESYSIPLIQHLHSLGFAVYLSTTGLHYTQKIAEIEPHIAKLSLPLDGFDEVSNQVNGRNHASFATTVGILNLYLRRPAPFPIKIGTVLTRKNANLEHLRRMRALLSQYPIDRWKIYQFIPESRGALHSAEYLVGNDQFRDIAETLTEEFGSKASQPMSVEFLGREQRSSAYFILQPDASVIVPIDDGTACEERVVGNLLRDPVQDVVSTWAGLADSMKYAQNSERRAIVRPTATGVVDQLDRRIVFQLDSDPLRAMSELARLCDLDEDSLKRRLEKLHRFGVITDIIAVVNVASLGFDVFLVSLYFQGGQSADHLAQVLCHHENIAWVAECYDWDESTPSNPVFRVAIFARDNFEMARVLNELRDFFGRSAFRYDVEIVPEKYVYSQRYLIGEALPSAMDTSHITLNSRASATLTRSECDFLLGLKVIDRVSIGALATYMNTDVRSASRVMESLESKLILNKFEVVVDVNALGYKCYLVFLKFASDEGRARFEDGARPDRYVTHINHLNGGRWDMDVEIRGSSSDECFAAWERIRHQFGDDIEQSKLIRVQREHKFDFLVPVVVDAITQARNTTKKQWPWSWYQR